MAAERRRHVADVVGPTHLHVADICMHIPYLIYIKKKRKILEAKEHKKTQSGSNGAGTSADGTQRKVEEHIQQQERYRVTSSCRAGRSEARRRASGSGHGNDSCHMTLREGSLRIVRTIATNVSNAHGKKMDKNCSSIVDGR